MTLRFQQGEMAIFAIAVNEGEISHMGEQVEITAVGPFKRGDRVKGKTTTGIVFEDCDYLIFFPSDPEEAIVKDYQLRNINPPEEPALLKRTSDIEEEVTA